MAVPKIRETTVDKLTDSNQIKNNRRKKIDYNKVPFYIVNSIMRLPF